ncbi:acyltransferase [Rhodococcoides trifolii]|uniref:Acyltransferase n=1 Tax=Rhodococcoides trifolii TaxID=908250 RepID=A0A917D5Y9_9NOCA|nr:acyltransferase [Rhodococcus trifolii]
MAIALVVVFHVWLGRVSGGVDVFLVLSGYFFVGGLVRRAQSGGSLAAWPAVVRVLRRLLPMLALTVAATVLVFAFLLPRTRWDDLFRQGLTSVSFVQNWELARTSSDYLRADASISPMQHLWSMAVQGQFYLLAIVVVWAVTRVCSRRGLSPVRPLVAILGVAAAASFMYASVMSSRYQAWAYYDSAARLWELLVGALLALIVLRAPTSRAARTALAFAGLVTIALCGVLLNGAEQFPGPWALVPVLATVALTVAGGTADGRSNSVSAVLASRPLVWLGSIAYPLYLVHWPVLIGTLVVSGRPEIGVDGGTAVVLASLVGAQIMMWVVGPASRPSRARTVVTTWSYGLAAAVVVASVGWTAHVESAVTGGRPADSLDQTRNPGARVLVDGVLAPDAPMVPSVYDAGLDLPASTTEGCIVDVVVRDVVRCTYGDTSAARTVALVGGSHSEHWLTAFDRMGKDGGFRVDTYLKVGCPLTVDTMPSFVGNDYPDCLEWSLATLDALDVDRPDYVVTTSTRPRPDGPGDWTPEWYVSAWLALADRGLPVVAIRDTPWLHDDGVPYRTVDCLSGGGDATSCGMPRADVLSDVDPAADATAALPTVSIMDLTDSVCAVDVCRAAEGNVLIYHDAHHLTASYVTTLVPELNRQFSAATGW